MLTVVWNILDQPNVY